MKNSTPTAMSRRAALGLLALGGLQGCNSLRGWQKSDEFAKRTNCPLGSSATADDYVAHINQNVDRIDGWRAGRVHIRANHIPLSADIAVQKSNLLRISVTSALGQEVDLGSNDEIFWFWAKRNDPPDLMFARHEQMAEIQQRMPIPFEPAWLMEALGVAPMEPESVTLNRSGDDRTAALTTSHLSPSGIPIRKVVTVDACHGLVLEHGLYDPQGRVIAQGRLKNHFRDQHSGAILPRQMTLDWPLAQMNMVLTFDKIEVNPAGVPEQVWQPPEMPNTRLVNMAEAMRS
ncbi:MAG: hypothetical protein C0478_03950 [Planctomyces sp.]|nr:hypothetical protein [Planctomyces sp.]